MMMSPNFTYFCKAPHVPMRRKFFAPTWINSSTAIASAGQPIPVADADRLVETIARLEDVADVRDLITLAG